MITKEQFDNRDTEQLTESELREMLWQFDVVHEVKSEPKRWTRPVTTVLNIYDELYALDWDEGLTENQEHMFEEQP